MIADNQHVVQDRPMATLTRVRVIEILRAGVAFTGLSRP
jgi:hypothetical protein